MDCGLQTGCYCHKANLSWQVQEIAAQREELRFLRESERTVVLRDGSYETKALNWPEVEAKDSASLDIFSIFLTRCKNAMECSKYLTKPGQPDTIQKLNMAPFSRLYHSLKL